MIIIYVTVIIIVITIIVLVLLKHKDSFVVKLNNNSTGTKNVQEIYTFPNCTGCVTLSNKLKPYIMYTFTDNRCAKSNTYDYIDATHLSNLVNYSLSQYDINNKLSSCSSEYNSLFSTIKGKYILLFRQDSIKIRLNHISIYERNYLSSPIQISSIYTTNQNIDPTTILNVNNTSVLEFGGNYDIKKFEYMLITLINEINIGYINIKHSNIFDAETLNGSILMVLQTIDNNTLSNIKNNLTDPSIPFMGNIVFYVIIKGNDINRKIYTYNHLDDLTKIPIALTSNVLPIVNNWQLPCSNCVTKDGKLFKYHYYEDKARSRCFIPITDDIDKSVVDNDIISESILSTKFLSCNPQFNTLYSPSFGKFIQISRISTDNKPIKINSLVVYSEYSDKTYYDKSSLYALVKTYINNVNTFDKVLDDNLDTFLETSDGSNSRILIDLGLNNVPISGIKLVVPTSEKNNIIGLKIYVIKINELDKFNVSEMKITSEYTIVQSDTEKIQNIDDLYYSVVLPLSNNKNNESVSSYPDIIVNNQVTYNVANKYLTTHKNGSIYYQIPYTVYTMSNGRKVMAKNLKDSVNTIDKISNSDASLLFNFPDVDLTGFPIGQQSYIITPISARYIHIKPDISRDISSIIKSIILYRKDKTIIKTISNPNLIYEVIHNTYEKYLYDTNVNSSVGFILIDLEINVEITFIKITLNVDPKNINVNNSVISLINNNNKVVYTYTINNITESTTNVYIITDYNLLNNDNTSFVNKFAYPNCLTNGICNNVMPNSYYIITDDNRCYMSTDVPCDRTCMTNLLTGSGTNNTIFKSCVPDRDSRTLSPITDFPSFWLQVSSNNRAIVTSPNNASIIGMSPFHQERFLQDPVQNMECFRLINVTGGIRIYTDLSKIYKFKAIRIINYYDREWEVDSVKSGLGIKNTKIYITNVIPTAGYNTGITNDRLILDREIPINDGNNPLGNNISMGNYNANSFCFPVINELSGRYVVVDIANNWGSSEGTGFANMEFAVSIPLTGTALILPVRGRYIKFNRIDGIINPVVLKRLEVYNSQNVIIPIVNGIVYPSYYDGYNWNSINNQNRLVLTSTKGLIDNEYIQFDLGADYDIAFIKVRGGRNDIFDAGSRSQQHSMQGCTMSVLDSNMNNLGQYLFQEVAEEHGIGFISSTWKNTQYKTITNSTDPNTIVVKWDCQVINSVKDLKGADIYYSEQLMGQWNETKTGDNKWNYKVYDLYAGSGRFTVDKDGYPGIKLPVGCNLTTSGDTTMYYNGTYFIVIATSYPTMLYHGLFEMGNSWNMRHRYDSNYSNPRLTFKLAPINYNGLTDNDNKSYFNGNISNNDFSSSIDLGINKIPPYKKLVIGFRINKGTGYFNFKNIYSLNPRYIYSSPSIGTDMSLIQNNYRNINTKYSLNSRHNSVKQGSRHIGDELGVYFGDPDFRSGSMTMYEMNIHDSLLSDADMITECARLMTKWGIV